MVIVIVHPLIDRRCLLADRFQRRVRMQQRERSRQAAIGHPVHADLSVIVGDIPYEPIDRIVGVGGLVGGLRVVRIDPGR